MKQLQTYHKSNKKWSSKDVMTLHKLWDLLRYKLEVIDICNSFSMHGSFKLGLDYEISYNHWPRRKYRG